MPFEPETGKSDCHIGVVVQVQTRKNEGYKMTESTANLMYEFSFVDRTADEPTVVVDRLRTMLDIVTKLEKAGCTVRFTLTGIAFDPPSKKWFKKQYLKTKLEAIGIAETVTEFPSRTMAEAEDALSEIYDRIWYERKLIMMRQPNYDPKRFFRDRPVDCLRTLTHMRRIEQEHKAEEFTAKNDFGRGVANGKLSALRWILGQECTV
jgi:hypothetical protein